MCHRGTAFAKYCDFYSSLHQPLPTKEKRTTSNFWTQKWWCFIKLYRTIGIIARRAEINFTSTCKFSHKIPSEMVVEPRYKLLTQLTKLTLLTLLTLDYLWCWKYFSISYQTYQSLWIGFYGLDENAWCSWNFRLKLAISWHILVALADRTNLLRLKLMANSSFRIKKNNHQILQGLSLSSLHLLQSIITK